jgi:hypothetical protein
MRLIHALAEEEADRLCASSEEAAAAAARDGTLVERPITEPMEACALQRQNP